MPEWASALIAFVTGGGLLAVVGVILEHRKSKRSEKKQSIDERIDFWEKAAAKNESAIESLERKYETRISALENRLSLYEANFQILQNHISSLELIIIRIDPNAQIPDRPKLLTWNGVERRNPDNDKSYDGHDRRSQDGSNE